MQLVLSLGLIVFLQNFTSDERVLAVYEAAENNSYALIQTQTFDQWTVTDTRYYEAEDIQPVGVRIKEPEKEYWTFCLCSPVYDLPEFNETRSDIFSCDRGGCDEPTRLAYPSLDLDVCMSIIDGKVTKCLSEMPRRPLGITSL